MSEHKDEVQFHFKEQTYYYYYNLTHLTNKKGSNNLILSKLGLDTDESKVRFCSTAYGYEARDNIFPECKTQDFDALDRGVEAINKRIADLTPVEDDFKSGDVVFITQQDVEDTGKTFRVECKTDKLLDKDYYKVNESIHKYNHEQMRSATVEEEIVYWLTADPMKEPVMKFKIGQMVKLVEGGRGIAADRLGDIFTIKGYFKDKYIVKEGRPDGSRYGSIREESFEAVIEVTTITRNFKIGDKVLFKGKKPGDSLPGFKAQASGIPDNLIKHGFAGLHKTDYEAHIVAIHEKIYYIVNFLEPSGYNLQLGFTEDKLEHKFSTTETSRGKRPNNIIHEEIPIGVKVDSLPDYTKPKKPIHGFGMVGDWDAEVTNPYKTFTMHGDEPGIEDSVWGGRSHSKTWLQASQKDYVEKMWSSGNRFAPTYPVYPSTIPSRAFEPINTDIEWNIDVNYVKTSRSKIKKLPMIKVKKR